MDVLREIGADGFGRERKARGPLLYESVNVREAMVARELEIAGELDGGEFAEEVGTAGPDGGDPGQAGAGVPLVGEVEILAGAAKSEIDFGAAFKGEQGGIANEERGIGLREHGDGVGGYGEELWSGAEEVLEENLGVGDGRSGGRIGRNGSDGFEGVTGPEEKEDGADTIKRSDRAAGDDGEVRGEGGDRDQAESGTAGKELQGTLGRCGVVERVAGGEFCGEGWVFKIPHERGGVEEVDGGDGQGWHVIDLEEGLTRVAKEEPGQDKGRDASRPMCGTKRELAAATTASEKLENGEEDVNAIEVDGEREHGGGDAVAASSNASKVSDGE